MKMILRKVHIYFYVLSVVIFYFLMWPLLYYYYRKNNYKGITFLRHYWAMVSAAFAGLFYRFTYEVPIDWGRTYIICPNHTSNLDVSGMCVMVKGTCSFIGKEELASGLVTRLFFRSIDITVNRDSKISAYRAFKKAAERLQQQITMVIFPEGLIGDDYPPVLHPFKNGPFRLAIEHQVPVIPVTSLGVWKHLWDDGTKHGSKPGICHFYVHKPIETTGLTVDDADALRDKVYTIIQQKLASVN